MDNFNQHKVMMDEALKVCGTKVCASLMRMSKNNMDIFKEKLNKFIEMANQDDNYNKKRYN